MVAAIRLIIIMIICYKERRIHPERIGIIGICGWGGLALNAAALDTRIKATAASTMYDMARVNAPPASLPLLSAHKGLPPA